MNNFTQPIMTDKIVTEKDYPITTLWVFKAPIIMFLVSAIALFFGIWFPYLVIAFPILLIINPLNRANFHYSLEDKFFIVRQGILSKKQRTVPYGVIQNVFVKQDLFDRIFGLALLSIENASQGGGFLSGKKSKNFKLSGTGVIVPGETVGSSGNKVNVPGLKKQDAESLKVLILQKIKENPIEESGL